MGTVDKAKDRIQKARHYGPGFLFWRTMDMIGLGTRDKYVRYVEKYYLSLNSEEREAELKKWFLNKVGYPLDLENPKTFDEKIQWLKLYDLTPEKTLLSDKYLVRDWIVDQIGEQYLIPLLGVWDSCDEIDFDALPQRFVLKSNLGSTMNIIVKDAAQIDCKKIRKETNVWLHTNYGINAMQEWQYFNAPHKILAEQYIGTADKAAVDYKVYCFNGTPKYIHIIEGRFNDPKQLFLNVDWEAVPFWCTEYERLDTVPEKPGQLEKMLRFSEKLAKDFVFVRVDWYLIGEEDIYFGEMTFTPASGINHWIPEGTDEMLGDLINLPKEKYEGIPCRANVNA